MLPVGCVASMLPVFSMLHTIYGLSRRRFQPKKGGKWHSSDFPTPSRFSGHIWGVMKVSKSCFMMASLGFQSLRMFVGQNVTKITDLGCNLCLCYVCDIWSNLPAHCP